MTTQAKTRRIINAKLTDLAASPQHLNDWEKNFVQSLLNRTKAPSDRQCQKIGIIWDDLPPACQSVGLLEQIEREMPEPAE